jgi:hypothetical protein
MSVLLTTTALLVRQVSHSRSHRREVGDIWNAHRAAHRRVALPCSGAGLNPLAFLRKLGGWPVAVYLPPRFAGAFGIAIVTAVFTAHGSLASAAGVVAGYRPALAVSAVLSLADSAATVAIGRRRAWRGPLRPAGGTGSRRAPRRGHRTLTQRAAAGIWATHRMARRVLVMAVKENHATRADGSSCGLV